MEFQEIKVPNFLGEGIVKRWLLKKEGPEFYIQGSQAGVEIKGELTLTNMEELDEWAKTVSLAWQHHKKLLSKLTQNAAGH